MPVSFVTAASLVYELMEARDEKRLLRLQRQLAKVKLLIIDELGFLPLSKTGAELLFELISQRYECGSTLITSYLSFEKWTETFGTERLTATLLDCLPHHVNILEMNGESYRPNQSKSRSSKPNTACWPDGHCALESACYMMESRLKAKYQVVLHRPSGRLLRHC